MDVSDLGAKDARRLEISNLHREFGDVVALEDASLSVGIGEIVGLVGRNGAGKTTLMRSVRLATRIYKATLVRSGPRLSWREPSGSAPDSRARRLSASAVPRGAPNAQWARDERRSPRQARSP
jgi:ABC-type glutathione transport system ATPase component